MDVFYSELREKVKEIEQVERARGEVYALGRRKDLFRAIDAILSMSYIARREGLLALEETANEMTDDNFQGYLKDLVLYVVDGTDPEFVRELGFMRYFASNMSDYEGLIFLIYLEGMLAVQAGENPRIIEEKMKCMLPKKYVADFVKRREDTSYPLPEYVKKAKEKEKEEDENIVQKAIEENGSLDPREGYYFHAKLVEHLLLEINDRCVQRIFREIDNYDLVRAMKLLSPAAKQKIFNNLSERLGIMIAVDYKYATSVRAVDAVEALQNILNVGVRLSMCGEITVPSEGVLCVFNDALKEDLANIKDSIKTRSNIFDLAKEYERRNNSWI